MQIQFSEKELEDFLCKDKNLEKYLGLKFIARQVNIDPIGIIDILAFDKAQKCWVIIELKKDLLDKDSIVQGLSYLQFYKTISNYKDCYCDSAPRKFKLLMIGQNLASDVHKIVCHYDDCFNEEWDIYYALFSLNFQNGINFNYYNSHQKQLYDKVNDLRMKKNLNISFCTPIRNRCVPEL